ncbi:MAG: Crp/Fnr family transcriptional regulator, partial [Bacteroidota bacterium]|nr:Crp/Fnr family transcriptional regulator [Bacteroidota bacterium]
GFVSLSRTEFNLLLSYLEIREFDKRVQVVRQGEVEKYVNLIAKGLVRKFVPLKNKEITLQLATEGHIVHSELSFHTQAPSGAVLETIEPTTFISISYDNLQELYREFPKAERLGRLIVSDLFIKKDFRYFDQLQKSTRERFLEYVRSHPHMLQRVPQKFIASYLNIKPETFSRLKHLLRGK